MFLETTLHTAEGETVQRSSKPFTFNHCTSQHKHHQTRTTWQQLTELWAEQSFNVHFEDTGPIQRPAVPKVRKTALMFVQAQVKKRILKLDSLKNFGDLLMKGTSKWI